jgi:hypothetical protein
MGQIWEVEQICRKSKQVNNFLKESKLADQSQWLAGVF